MSGARASGPRRYLSPGPWGVILALSVAAVGVGYAVAVAPGLPYDEPSHWGYARWLGEHGTLPVLGERSVGYEAQMGPVAYVLPALVAKLAAAMGWGSQGALVAARVAGLVPLAAAWWGIVRVVRLAAPTVPGSTIVAATSVAVLNPMVMAVGLSVQNDITVLALGSWLLVLVLRQGPVPPSPRAAAVIGLVAGAALLTKVVVAPALAAVLVWAVMRWRRAGLPAVLVAVAASAAVSGWWFQRNVQLYGDPTGRQGVTDRLGIVYPPLGLDPLPAAGSLFRSAVAYLWFPGDYYRGALGAPTALQLLLLGVTLAAVAAGALGVRASVTPEVTLVLMVALASVGAWVLTVVGVQAVPFRAAYMALPGYALLLTAAARRMEGRVFAAGAVALLVGLHAWTLLSVAAVSYPPGVRL